LASRISTPSWSTACRCSDGRAERDRQRLARLDVGRADGQRLPGVPDLDALGLGDQPQRGLGFEIALTDPAAELFRDVQIGEEKGWP
jgi:hypothetical protein